MKEKTIQEYIIEYKYFMFNGKVYSNLRRSGQNREMISAHVFGKHDSYFQIYDNIFVDLIKNGQITHLNDIEKILYNIEE